MANLIRSAKSGSDWTLNDLDSYHITVNPEEPLSFFGLRVGEDNFAMTFPQPSVDQELLSNANANSMQQDRHAELITYLDLAMILPLNSSRL
jgi:hypothetical protein